MTAYDCFSNGCECMTEGCHFKLPRLWNVLANPIKGLEKQNISLYSFSFFKMSDYYNQERSQGGEAGGYQSMLP